SDLADALREIARQVAGTVIADVAGVKATWPVRIGDRTRRALTLLDAPDEPILLDIARADAAVGECPLAVAARVGEIRTRHVGCQQRADDRALETHTERAVVLARQVVDLRLDAIRHAAVGIAGADRAEQPRLRRLHRVVPAQKVARHHDVFLHHEDIATRALR